jgi:hypothetical protein
VGCPPGEWHTFTPLLISLFLRRRGLNVIYLGANVPSARFAETISQVKADLIILISQTLISAASLQNAAITLADQKVPVCFAGRIFKQHPALIDTLPAHYLGDSIEASLDHVESLLKSKPKAVKPRISSQKYTDALHAFRAHRLQIENEIRGFIPPASDMLDAVDTGTQLLGDNIIAALQFGSLELVSDEMGWLKALLEAHHRPPQELSHFMKNYVRAADNHLDAKGELIKTWLHEQVKSLGG